MVLFSVEVFTRLFTKLRPYRDRDNLKTMHGHRGPEKEIRGKFGILQKKLFWVRKPFGILQRKSFWVRKPFGTRKEIPKKGPREPFRPVRYGGAFML